MPKVTFAELSQQAPPLKRISEIIEEWGGGTFWLRELSGLEHQRFIAQLREARKEQSLDQYGAESPHTLAATLLSYCVEDEDGQKPAVEWLLTQPIHLLLHLRNKAMELNGLDAKAQEKLVKN